MKDNEMRERFDKLERMIAAATSQIVGGKTTVEERLMRLQELAEAGRRFDATRRLGQFKVLPEVVFPIIGLLCGALIFAAGMFAGTFLK